MLKVGFFSVLGAMITLHVPGALGSQSLPCQYALVEQTNMSLEVNEESILTTAKLQHQLSESKHALKKHLEKVKLDIKAFGKEGRTTLKENYLKLVAFSLFIERRIYLNEAMERLLIWRIVSLRGRIGTQAAFFDFLNAMERWRKEDSPRFAISTYFDTNGNKAFETRIRNDLIVRLVGLNKRHRAAQRIFSSKMLLQAFADFQGNSQAVRHFKNQWPPAKPSDQVQLKNLLGSRLEILKRPEVILSWGNLDQDKVWALANEHARITAEVEAVESQKSESSF